MELPKFGGLTNTTSFKFGHASQEDTHAGFEMQVGSNNNFIPHIQKFGAWATSGTNTFSTEISMHEGVEDKCCEIENTKFMFHKDFSKDFKFGMMF